MVMVQLYQEKQVPILKHLYSVEKDDLRSTKKMAEPIVAVQPRPLVTC